MGDYDYEERVQALVEFLEVDPDEVEGPASGQTDDFFVVDSEEYLVLDDNEANEFAREEIEDSLWAFNPAFLACETELPEEVFEPMSNLYESANGAIRAIIDKTCGMDQFVESAIAADGRGHFLSRYDGEENEVMVETIVGEESKTFYIYRK